MERLLKYFGVAGRERFVASSCSLKTLTGFFFSSSLDCDAEPAVLNYEPKALGWEQSIKIPGVVCNVHALVSMNRLPLNTVPQQVK